MLSRLSLSMKTKENAGQKLVGPRQIQNGQHVNKGEMHRIIISSGPCGKLGSRTQS